MGDTLRTGADGALGITLTDDTLLTIGANSELVLSTYSFDSTTQDGNLLVSLWKGTAAFVTGLIARKAPDNVRVQTRTVVLGVRGTEFIVDAQQGQP
ncbi:MAG: FecR family protein [Aquabacterium sp.]|nr:FecR family protein [Aquabacterium sp.]